MDTALAQKLISDFLARAPKDEAEKMAQTAIIINRELSDLARKLDALGELTALRDVQVARESALVAFAIINVDKRFGFAAAVSQTVDIEATTAQMEELHDRTNKAGALLNTAAFYLQALSDFAAAQQTGPLVIISGIAFPRILRGDHARAAAANLVAHNQN